MQIILIQKWERVIIWIENLFFQIDQILFSFLGYFLSQWINSRWKCVHIDNAVYCLVFVFAVVFWHYTHCLGVAVFNYWLIYFLCFIELNKGISTSMIMNECFQKFLNCQNIMIVRLKIIIYNLNIIYESCGVKACLYLFEYLLHFCITFLFNRVEIWLIHFVRDFSITNSWVFNIYSLRLQHLNQKFCEFILKLNFRLSVNISH